MSNINRTPRKKKKYYSGYYSPVNVRGAKKSCTRYRKYTGLNKILFCIKTESWGMYNSKSKYYLW